MKKSVFLGVLIYFTLVLNILAACGIYILFIPAFILDVIVFKTTKDMNEKEVFSALGAYYIQNKFKTNPLFKDLTEE